MAETRIRMTSEELLRLPDDGKRRELVQGELREMAPAGGRHGDVAGALHVLLGHYVREQRLGKVPAAETGFLVGRNPDTVRAPDVCFIARDRVPPTGSPRGYWDLAPDLVAEVVSPNDTAAEVQSKVQMWLETGVRLVWVVYPDTRSVMAYESLKEISTFTTGDTLSGDNVVPGFECSVSEIFE
jgi:Uma2 family endonuclease